MNRGQATSVGAAGANPLLKRRGLMAAIAAATAGILSYAADRSTNVALAADQVIDGQLIFTTPVVNTQRDIHTQNNIGGLRFYNASSLTASPDGAAIQFWGNGSGLPGQALIDAGAHNAGGVALRTATAGGTITERMRINSEGNTVFYGNVSITGQKEFVMDHPLDPDNKYLYHSAIEAPEQLNIYSGNVTTDATGQATIKLPAYFEAINRDFRYQLTVIGDFVQAIVSTKIKNNQFTIRTEKPGVEVSWQVSGIRNDARSRRHPFVAERPKKDDERGTLLHPEDYDQPDTRSLRWRRSPERILREDREPRPGRR